MFDAMNQFDCYGTQYRIVAAHCRPGRYHVNRNEWDADSESYDGAARVLSDVPLEDAKQYVTEQCVAANGGKV